MSRICELTGKRALYGNLVSHSNIKTRTHWKPNMKHKKYFVPELGLTTTLYLSANGIKTIDKHGGISNAVLKANSKDLSENLLILKNKLMKRTRVSAKAATEKTAKTKK